MDEQNGTKLEEKVKNFPFLWQILSYIKSQYPTEAEKIFALEIGCEVCSPETYRKAQTIYYMFNPYNFQQIEVRSYATKSISKIVHRFVESLNLCNAMKRYRWTHKCHYWVSHVCSFNFVSRGVKYTAILNARLDFH